MSALERAIVLLAASGDPSWQRFDSIPGVTWQVARVQEDHDTPDTAEKYIRTGTLVLAGFGMVEVPDGKPGAQAGVRQVNEGEASITLQGDARQVHAIEIVKFYACDHPGEVITRQLSASARVTVLIRSGASSAAADEEPVSFYQITLDDGRSIHANSVAQDGGKTGPGFTIFSFYRRQPVEGMASVYC